MSDYESSRVPDDGLETSTSILQRQVEDSLISIYQSSPASLDLERFAHFQYLTNLSHTLPRHYSSLDASRTWMVYWILHSIDTLNLMSQINHDLDRFVNFLTLCQHGKGGFGGGPGQMAHLAPSYAAVMAIATIGTKEAFDVIDRKKMYMFLMNMKQKDGSFIMHEQGEVDVRASYCALAIASVCNLLTDELKENCADFISKCQTYEGGFGGEPGNEAHGGYTFCSVAALKILGEFDKIRYPHRLLKWTVDRQMKLEGGFQGRTNKLVDGCYSFWVGALFPILHEEMNIDESKISENNWLFDEISLQQYLIQACQHHRGGLIDKPGK